MREREERRGFQMKGAASSTAIACILIFVCVLGCTKKAPHPETSAELSDAEIENIVTRSYPYVAMYNVNNKFALKQGGWNTVAPDTKLKDHTMREIARPNNDTLYIGCMLDLRKDPVILEMPAFDSKYVSLMVTGYDHYVNVPMTTRLSDFKKPEKMLFYTARTQGYKGESVEGVDRLFEATGDFVSAIFRIMPHANEPERFHRIVDQMKSVKLVTLSEYQGGKAKPIDDVTFPPVGKTDADVFENNLLQVMQFVFNHTTFDPANPMDQAVLEAYKPLGVEPGKAFDPIKVAKIHGKRFRSAVERIATAEMAKATDPEFKEKNVLKLFQPKGRMTVDMLLFQSILGPIGLPAAEAVYPAVETADGKAMNANHDYVIRMGPDEMPPARAFWSFTLYDTENGFFIPNDRKKYSVGENGGMRLEADGGIAIYIAAQKPEDVPEENWLPLNRGDYGIDVILRLYNPDLDRFKTWKAPKSEMIGAHAGKQTSEAGGKVEILQSWQGDYPVARLVALPEGQREHGIGYIADAKIFENVWEACKPGEPVPAIDFKANLVLFARNTQFYNRISIGKVKVTNGVAEVLAMETMSAIPIEDKVAMSLAVVSRNGLQALKTSDNVIAIEK